MASEPGNEELKSVPDETQVGKETKIKDELIQNFYQSGSYEEIKKQMAKEFEAGGMERFKRSDNGLLEGWEGMMFEELALDYYYRHVSPDPENRALAEFLLSILKSNFFREVDFFEGNPSGFAKTFHKNREKKGKSNLDINSSLRLISGRAPERNPDALLVDIVDDKTTGKKVAKIIGIIDAKISGHIDAEQREGIKSSLTKVVSAIKPHYAEITESLDLSAVLPEELDIVPSEKLGVKIIRPEKSQESGANRITDDRSIFVPIKREEISNIVQAMIRDVTQPHR